MDSMGGILQTIIERAAARNPPENGDYRDAEGYLVCGKCHTRRECDLDLPTSGDNGQTVRRRVRTMCACRAKAWDDAKAREQQKKDMEAIASLKEQSLMDERLAGATFDHFQTTEKNARNLKLCRSYAERFDQMVEKNQGLLFYGGVGTGKTFAAACIANYLLEHRKPVVMTSFVKLVDAMQSFKEEDEKTIAKLNRAKLLIIDDLGAERENSFALEKVYNIIDSRYRAKLPVILTTNLSLDEMKRATDIRYARIYDRIFELCYPMQFAGLSWRKAEAARRYREMESFLEESDE